MGDEGVIEFCNAFKNLPKFLIQYRIEIQFLF